MAHKFLCILSLSLLLAGCSDTNQPNSSGSNDPLSVILITDVGGLGDKGFNDAGWVGCQDAERRLKAEGVDISIKAIESREQTDYTENLTLSASRADVVVALGFLIQDAVAEIAPKFPDTTFIFIDGSIKADNVASFTFKAQEGGFLAGLLAGAVSKTGTVAVMPGMDIPPVERFAIGYEAGVKTASGLLNRPIKVLSTTIGSFNDPVKAKSIAQSLMNQGADIILQLAGNSGLGVIEAVRDAPEGHYAIGVDIDQDDLEPGKVLTSVLKRMDKVVSDKIVDAYRGTIQYGVFDVGLKDGYIGLTDMRHTKHLVSKTTELWLETAKKEIAKTPNYVPATRDELDAYMYPMLKLRAQLTQ